LLSQTRGASSAYEAWSVSEKEADYGVLEPFLKVQDGDDSMHASVLLVHKQSEILEHLSSSLGGLGFHVVTARTGGEAQALIYRDEFDVAVLDLLMEGTDAIGLLRQVRSLLPLTEVILLATEKTVAAAAKAMWLGAFDYVLACNAAWELPLKILEARIRKSRQEEKIRLAEASSDCGRYYRNDAKLASVRWDDL
jgi:two-component system, OmpR family, response regulator